jgi:hypothetical protein
MARVDPSFSPSFVIKPEANTERTPSVRPRRGPAGSRAGSKPPEARFKLEARARKRLSSRAFADGRCRARTSDLLLVRDSQAGKGGTRASKPDPVLSCKARAFVDWLSAGGDSVCTN